MKKLSIASVLIASLGATVLTAPAFAETVVSNVTATLQQALDANTSIEQAVQDAITADPSNAEAIIAAAIAIVGANSDQISSILTAATNAGVSADVVTSVAIANNVDATVASQATAAGNNTSNQTANNSNAGAGNNNSGGNTNRSGNAAGGGGGGGGAGGISEIGQ